MRIVLRSSDLSVTILAFWCGRCGEHRVAGRGEHCARCRAIPRLEDFACGVCGRPAQVYFVYGHRCQQHQDVRVPSQQIGGGSDFVGSVSMLLRRKF